MNQILKKTLKKSQLNSTNEIMLNKISKNNEHFVQLQINKVCDDYEFNYNVSELQPWSNLKNSSTLVKYKVLINLYELLKKTQDFSFSTNLNNLYYDLNLEPKVLHRDLNVKINSRQRNLVNAYLATIGATLQNKYTYENIYFGGQKLLANTNTCEKYANFVTLEQIHTQLIQDYENLNNKLQSQITEVSKIKYKRLKKYSIATLATSIIIGSFATYFGVIKLNEIKTFNDANVQYIQKDYESVIETLKNQNVKDMPNGTKYILAISSIKNENFSEQKYKNITSDLSIENSNDALDYWDYIGIANYKEAIENANASHNLTYELYAQQKLKTEIENDGSLKSNEKDSKLQEVNKKIQDLANQLNIQVEIKE